MVLTSGNNNVLVFLCIIDTGYAVLHLKVSKISKSLAKLSSTSDL